MNLWIRSQDKRIIQKVDNIYLNSKFDNKRICFLEKNSVLETTLGEYKTEERALEVLDEIQNILKYSWTIDEPNYNKADIYVKAYMITAIEDKFYQMPKE